MSAQYETEPPVAVIIGPPWLRTGTGRVLEDQIAYYRDRGFKTAFVAVPVNSAHVAENSMWAEMSDAVGELRADHASFAILRHREDPNNRRRRIRQSLFPQTALDWIVEIGSCSRPSPALLSYLRDRSIAVFHVNHVFTLGFARRLRRQLGRLKRRMPLLVETHDIQSQILHERNERNPWTGRPDDLDILIRSETGHLAQADVLIHCSVDDQRFFSEQLPNKPQLTARPIIDDAFVAAVKKAKVIDPIDILFVGTQYHANREGVEWFLTAVWPLIENQHLRLTIVGAVVNLLHKTRPDLCERFRDSFTGHVSELAPYYRAARSVIAPMRSGGGISIKTVEAFALGMPFVGTSKAYRGFPEEPLVRNGIQKHDDPYAFAQAILKALSSDDDTGRRGRAVYDELFSRDACYAARDEAVRLARGNHGLRPYSRSASADTSRAAADTRRVRPEAKVSGIEVLALGSSNCIGAASYIEKLCAKSGAKLTNLSVGACSSTLGVYQLHKVEPVSRGVAFIDFAINDNDAGWNLWGKRNAPGTIADNLRTVVARLRSLNFLPIVIMSASVTDFESEPYGHALHRDICKAEGINFLNIRDLVVEAIKRGGSQHALMRDAYHISERSADEVAACLAAIVTRMNATAVNFVPQSTSILRARVVHAPELFPPGALIERGSLLRSALHGRLATGEVLHVPMGNKERLRGLMINVGAKGGTVMLRTRGAEIIKSMTTYWDAKYPEQFGSILIDFGHPLLGDSGGVSMQIVDPDAAPTERTIHSKPLRPGRYGEIEIEGVLLTEYESVRYDYSAPVYDCWMPVDLGQLPESQQLLHRLASLFGTIDPRQVQ